MKEQIRYQASFHKEEDIQTQQIRYIKERARLIIISLALFSALLLTILIYREYSQRKLISDGIFYQSQLQSLEMLPFWKELGQEEINQNKIQLIEQGDHNITRQQLGKMGWTILHMMTGSFPKELDQALIKKWNIFLILFGHFYPCKLCSTHFLKMMKDVGPFKGQTKEQLMKYLCKIHNIVNKQLRKPIHDCENVAEEWNTCGCSQL